MSKKDFILIARTIAGLPLEYRATVASEFADALRATNARFDRTRFIDACVGK